MAKKKHPEKQLNECAINLLRYCAKNQNWETTYYEDKPHWNFIKSLSLHPEISSIFHWEAADFAVGRALKPFSNSASHDFSAEDTQSLISSTCENINLNAQPHWIFIPLKDAVLTRTIEFGNIALISGSKDEKLKVIQRLSGSSQTEVDIRAKHTLENKEPDFYSSPIIGIKIKHQFEHVERQSKMYALWLISIAYTMYWGTIYPKYKPQKFKIRTAGDAELEHGLALVWGQENWSHILLEFEPRCALNLIWLEKEEHQERFLKIIDEIVEKKADDKLRMRFFKGFRFFIKAIYSEEDKDPFEGVELTLLYLIVIAEGILLNGESGKRVRLTDLLSQLANILETTLPERKAIVDKAYRWRSEFVHAGEEIDFPRTNISSRKEITQSIDILKRMIAKLLCDSTHYVQEMEQQINEHQDTLESLWFKHLRTVFGANR